MAQNIYAKEVEIYTKFSYSQKAVEKKKQCITQSLIELVEKLGKGGEPPTVYTRDYFDAHEKDEYSEYALVTKARIDAKGEHEFTELKIQSKPLQNILETIISTNSESGMFPNPTVFREPYYALFHCREAINKHVAKDEEGKKHLEYLKEFMLLKFQSLEEVQDKVGNDLIAFKNLGILFKAGCYVIGRVTKNKRRGEPTEMMQDTSTPECFLFHSISGEREDSIRGCKYVEISVLRWGFDGTEFGLTPETLEITEFPDETPISRLECYPVTAEIMDKHRQNMIKRGERWCRYMEANNCVYKGIAEVPRYDRYAGFTMHQQDMSGPVIVDYPAFMAANPWLKRSLGKGPDRISSQANKWQRVPKGSPPTADQALLCPAFCPGYNLEQKKWGLFDVEKLTDKTEKDWGSDAIDELQIDDRYLGILLPLVEEHCRNVLGLMSSNFAKGQGLIFLLHGPPGCGKTLTAELLAQAVMKPLLSISCGDLGQHSSEFDRNLQALLRLALRGQAIVLIDEADTFLAKRAEGASRSYEQVAITSIFLKQLEYFPGVVFLTTNHQAQMDQAALSRVISLHYKSLDREKRTEIWKRQLANIKDADKEDIESLCNDLGRYKLDGRQIQKLAHITRAWCDRNDKPIHEKESFEYICNIIHSDIELEN